MHDGAAVQLEVEQPGRPLGLGGDRQLHRGRLRPGDSLVLYSDGVVEARGDGGQRFSDRRLRAAAERAFSTSSGLHVVVRDILDDVSAYAHGLLRDDATLFCVRWTG
jgi:serine phosphatase RsbU (regulator of sigma subunit)